VAVLSLGQRLFTRVHPYPPYYMASRLSQVSGHLTNNHGRGLLAGEVAIITGESEAGNALKT
jgi:hypothetical protein